MEAILIFIAIVIGWSVVGALFSAGTKTVGAAGKALLGKGSFSENMDLAFKGMQPFQIQFKDTHLNDDGTGPLLKEIQGKGLFPLSRKTNVGFLISVFDNTNDKLAPVLSLIEKFQEENSIAFQHGTAIGEIETDQGFVNWVRIGVIIPEMLQSPYGGRRKLKMVARMVDVDNIPDIENGYHSEADEGIIWQRTLDFEWEFNEKGYLEASEHRDEAVGLSLKIGMAVAMADGSLDEDEGNVLKQWIMKSIEPFSDEKRERLKALYNEAMRQSYKEALNGDISLSALTSRLNEIGEKSDKYEALELCFEVMAADGVAEDNELKVIRSIAQALGLDMQEVSKMRDQKIINLNTSVSGQASIETMLGIEPEWSSEQVMKHLRVEFQKWNNRLNTLEAGEERDNAQIMLDRIADARKKYAS